MKVKTEELIKDLVRDAEDQRTAAVSFGGLAKAWCVVTGSLALVAIALLVRESHFMHLGGPLLESCLLFLGGIVSGLVGIRLGFPDLSAKRPVSPKVVLLFPALALVSLSLGAVTGIRTHPMGLSLQGCMCSVELFAVSSIPGFYLLFLINRAAPLRSMLTAGCSLLSAGLLGSAVLHLACRIDDISHLLVYHLLPVAFLVGIAFLFCDFLVRKR